MVPGLVDAAIAQADYCAKRDGERMTVYYREGPDKWGRTGIFYVRSQTEGPPPCGFDRIAYVTEGERS